MLTLEIFSFVLEIPNDGYTALCQFLLINCSTLSQQDCKLIGWCWDTMRRQLLSLSCPINPTCITLCFQFLIASSQPKWVTMTQYSFKPVSTSHQCRGLIYVYLACSYLHCCPDYSHAWATAIALSNYTTLKHKNRVEDEVLSRQYFVIFNKHAFEF